MAGQDLEEERQREQISLVPVPELLKLSAERAAACRPLCGLSQRIAVLLESPEVRAHSAWVACLDDLLGAVYSLFYAIHHGFSERQNALAEPDIGAVSVRAKNMAQCCVRTEGKWTAGFYVNNALFRIAAVYHRAMKIAAGELAMKILVAKASNLYKDRTGENWENGALKKVCCEVNNLKHTKDGIIKGRDAGLMEAIQSAGELLAFIEAVK
jgi:hypothetical protein